MKLVDDVSLPDFVRFSPEHLLLPANTGLDSTISELDLQTTFKIRPTDSEWSSVKSEMVTIADSALSLSGLSNALHVEDGPDDIIIKAHDMVSARDAAVAEQFYHADVARNGFCGILLVGLEGTADSTPETQVVNNAAMFEHVNETVRKGPLEDRLDDIQVVRPFFDTDYREEWMNLPRHVLDRLRVQFRNSLTAAQLEHVERDTENIKDRSRYIGKVFISSLIGESVIDRSPMVTCGVGSREIRLSLGKEQSEDETRALNDLHDDITRYLLDPTIEHGGERVVASSAIFVPKDQLHRASPYLSRHRRSVLGARCYANSGHIAPESWTTASGTEY